MHGTEIGTARRRERYRGGSRMCPRKDGLWKDQGMRKGEQFTVHVTLKERMHILELCRVLRVNFNHASRNSSQM